MSRSNESIGFLLGALLRRKSLVFRALLLPYHLTPRRYAILSRLWEEDGLHLNELAHRLYVDSSSLCRTLSDMEKAGLLIRRRNSQDRRVFHLYLSERSRALEAVLLPHVKKHNERMLSGISEESVESLRQTIRQMLVNFRQGKM
ncbi:MarR family winged helix-turn-helix transcriptional regulator [candidate division CSSED10-310 bacterium]|uniref:MarR family winged helix-turn-helix transcriptional regulator n=1 Tax=candidate division CSSED10-310 bacterium TaxID=2855610 RepID=A0ABV6Z1K5_UNCC1